MIKLSTQQPARTPRMTLGAVTRGLIAKPLRVLLYGVEGVGKSTFGACAPSPIFLAAEDGTAHLDVARFPEPHTWSDALEAVDVLTKEAHDYKTLVIDTLDWLEPMCWAHVIGSANNPKITSIEDFGFGKGYTAALDSWRVLLAALDRMRNTRGMNVIMLAHSWTKTFKNPEDDDYDRYEMKLNAKASGVLREWCDDVLFARHDEMAARDDKTKRVRGVSTGARVMHTTRTAAYDAKNRHDLPPVMPLSWEDYEAAVLARKPASVDTLRTRIADLLSGADAALATRVNAAVAKAGDDAAQLARIADRLNATIQTQGK